MSLEVWQAVKKTARNRAQNAVSAVAGDRTRVMKSNWALKVAQNATD
jgi:hypothetical protein